MMTSLTLVVIMLTTVPVYFWHGLASLQLKLALDRALASGGLPGGGAGGATPAWRGAACTCGALSAAAIVALAVAGLTMVLAGIDVPNFFQLIGRRR